MNNSSETEDRSATYRSITKFLHWSMALILLSLLSLGFYMTSLEASPFKFRLYGWHKSFGGLILFMWLYRLAWRRKRQKKVPPLASHKPIEKKLAASIHVILYGCMILLPLSGWLMSSAGDFSFNLFKLYSFPDLIEPNQTIFKLMREWHGYLAYGLIIAVGLHLAGALKHHILDKDETLTRMAPKFLQPHTNSLIIIVAVFLFTTSLIGGAVELLKSNYKETNPVAQPISKTMQPSETITTTDAQAWNIIKEQSTVNFKAMVQGKEFSGQFNEFNGKILFSPDDLDNSSVDVNVKIASVETGSPERDSYIAMPAWLNAESFPESKFTATKFKKINKNQYVANGFLTLRDIKMPLTLPFTLTIDDEDINESNAKMTTNFTIKRLDYGIGTGDWQNEDTVGNTVQVMVTIKAKTTKTDEN